MLALLAFAPAIAQVAPGTPAPASGEAATAPAGDQTIELSPFVVNASADQGYSAYNTLAGSRLNTSLRDTAASISVLTTEFLSDVAANDLTEALQWANNVQQDFNDVQGNDNESILGPATFRIRGLPATITRNYFTWRLSTDNYNVDRVEENRGPNSVLFGIGSAGGIINIGTKQAATDRDFRRVQLQTDDYGSLRGTFDINQTLIDRKLGVRLNLVESRRDSWREHVNNDTRRAHLATSFQVLPKTRIRAEFEIGEVESRNARNTSVYDGITRWLDAGRPLIDAPVTNAAQLTALGLQRFETVRRVTYVANTGALLNYQGQNHTFQTQNVIQDQSLASRTINTGGPGQVRYEDFTALSLYLEQRIAEKTFVELSFNEQIIDQTAYISGQGRFFNNALKADPHRFLPDGRPNPYAGNIMFDGDRSQRLISEEKLRNLRLSLSQELNLGKWGDYRFALLADYEKRNIKRRTETEVWEGSPFASGPDAQANQVIRRNYATEGQWGTYYLSGPEETGLIKDLPNPVPGVGPAQLSSTWARFGQNIFDTPETQRTFLIGAQARYFDGRLVLGTGFRRDKLERTVRRVARDAATQEWTLYYDNPTEEEYEGDTKTIGLVGHVTKNVSLFYNYSDSFQLPNLNHRILPDSRLAPNPESQGQDYGIRLSAFDGRLNARLNYFEVDLVGATGAGGGSGGGAELTDNATVLSQRIFNALVPIGAVTQGEADARTPNVNNATQDQRVEGYEFSLTGNVTKNWRVQMNYTHTDGFDSNIAPEVKAWIAENVPYFRQFAQRFPELVTANGLTIAQELDGYESEWADIFAAEGLFLQGNRRHKFNINTRYTLASGFFNRLFVGGGYRYVGKSQLTLDNPGGGATPTIELGNSYSLVNAFLGYEFRKIPFLDRGRLTVQFNVDNLLDWDEAIIGQYSSFPTVRRWVILPPRSWKLSANFSF